MNLRKNRSNHHETAQLSQKEKFDSHIEKLLKKHHSPLASIRRVLNLSRKEIAVLMNDAVAIVLLIILPLSVVLLTAFVAPGSGSNSSGDSGNLMSDFGIKYSTPIIGFIDSDHSDGYFNDDLSAGFGEILQVLEDEGECYITDQYTRNECEEQLGEGQMNGYILIEEGFEYNISTHFVAVFSVVVDSYDNFIMQDVLRVIDTAVALFKEQYGFSGAIQNNFHLVNVPDKAPALTNMSPFFFPLLVMAPPVLITSQCLIGDRPKDRMILTPAKKGEVISAKFLGGVAVNSLLAVVMTVSSLAFGMDTAVPGIMLFIALELNVIISVAFGIFLSSISKTTLQGFQYAILIVIVQELLMLFIKNDLFLSFFPLYSMQEMYRVGVMKTGNILGLTNSIGIPFLFYWLFECTLFVILGYLFYKRTKGAV